MANKKISQLTAAAALTGTELLPIVQDGVTVQTTAQDIADLGGGGGLPYLVYTALLTQTGTDAPVATVLQNTLGFNINITRSAGPPFIVYNFTRADSLNFDVTKTAFYLGSVTDSGNNVAWYKDFSSLPSTQIRIVPTVLSSGNNTDWENSRPVLFEIRIYP
jgi:hypothetical protein